MKQRSPPRIAITCQGDGSHAAFSAGVLQGLLEQDGDHGEIAAIGGMSYGSDPEEATGINT